MGQTSFDRLSASPLTPSMKQVIPFKMRNFNVEMALIALEDQRVAEIADEQLQTMALRGITRAENLAKVLGFKVKRMWFGVDLGEADHRTIKYNSHLKGDDRQFVVFHELGHLLLDVDETPIPGSSIRHFEEHLVETFACRMMGIDTTGMLVEELQDTDFFK